MAKPWDDTDWSDGDTLEAAEWNEHVEDHHGLREELVVRDVESELSSHTPHDGAVFIATDTGAVYDGDGVIWSTADRGIGHLSSSVFYASQYGTFQDAIDAAIDAGGGRVDLPEGEFTIANPLTIDDNILIRGNGTTLLPSNDDHMIHGDQIDYAGVQNVTILDPNRDTSGESAAIAVDSWRSSFVDSVTVEDYATGYRIRTTNNDHSTERSRFNRLESSFTQNYDMLIRDSVQDNTFNDMTFWDDPGIGDGSGLVITRQDSPVTPHQHGGNTFNNVKIVGQADVGLELVNWNQAWFSNVVVDGIDDGDGGGQGILIRAVGSGSVPNQLFFQNIWSNVNGQNGLRMIGDSPTDPIENVLMTNFHFGSNGWSGARLVNVENCLFANGRTYNNGQAGFRYAGHTANCRFVNYISDGDSFFSIDHDGDGQDNDYVNLNIDSSPEFGTRHTVNGYGENGTDNPSVGGDWSGNGREGVVVLWNDGDADRYSVYRDGRWWSDRTYSTTHGDVDIQIDESEGVIDFVTE